MTEQERQEGFIKALQEAEQRFGLTVVSTIQVEGLGPVMIVNQSHIKPGPISIAVIEGWESSESLNTSL